MNARDAHERRAAWEAQAARRTSCASGAETAEDAILRALHSGADDALLEAARIRAAAPLIDHDYLAFWVDELGLNQQWQRLG